MTTRNQPHSPLPYRFSWFDWFCFWYPPGWLILFNRHWQHYHSDPEGWRWPEYLLFLLPGGFYIAMGLRWLRLGGRAPGRQTVAIDACYQQAFQREILRPILRHHFRATLHQPQPMPACSRIIAIMNHAGMCFPWDFIGLGTLLSDRGDWFVQPVAHHLFFDHPWIRWWLPVGWSQTLGGIQADRSSLETALQEGETHRMMLYAPEGLRGLTKGWRGRHCLARFDPSFIQLSDRHQVPILPIVCTGNEHLHPWAIHLKRIASWLHLPIFPVSPLIPIFLLFPSMGVWAMPTRLRYSVQPLQKPWEGQPHAFYQNQRNAYRLAQHLRSHLQAVLNQEQRVVMPSPLPSSTQG